MADEAEQQPKEDIVELGVLEVPLELCLDINERHIAHHGSEGQEVVHFEGEGNDEFVEYG